MCLSTPDVPTAPERQDATAPKRPGSATPMADGGLSRRRGYAALIKSAGGMGGADLTPVSTTATAAKTNLGA